MHWKKQQGSGKLVSFMFLKSRKYLSLHFIQSFIVTRVKNPCERTNMVSLFFMLQSLASLLFHCTHIQICLFRLQKDRAVDLEKNVDALKLRLVTYFSIHLHLSEPRNIILKQKPATLFCRIKSWRKRNLTKMSGKTRRQNWKKKKHLMKQGLINSRGTHDYTWRGLHCWSFGLANAFYYVTKYMSWENQKL
jgi:hypothetical protein